jgi:amino acid adenylation domain-containing protein
MCRSLIVDKESEVQLEALLQGVEEPLLILCPDRSDVSELAQRFLPHRILGAADLSAPEQWRPKDVSPDSIAYLLFTSGSTGQPKAVMVSHANVLHYVDYVTRRYSITCKDRVSQNFDLTFDLSGHDLFVAWQRGACVCCPNKKQRFKPDDFIKGAGLTIWFSVPSTALFMHRLGVLKPDLYLNLRLSLFCGEALPEEIARRWALAAPNSVIENIYGPTELTIACTAYRWDDELSPQQCEHGIVPIGEPFDDMEVLIADENLEEVQDGMAGELLMRGPQMSAGYWQDEERTKPAFVAVPGKNGKVFYRTGDRVRRRGPGKLMVYLGRVDSQMQVLGYRVEMGEVECAVRQASGLDGVVAIGWPLTQRGADGIEVFVEAETLDVTRLVAELKSKLPPYMVPRNIRLLRALPLNSNGKFDRQALLKILEKESEAGIAAHSSW